MLLSTGTHLKIVDVDIEAPSRSIVDRMDKAFIGFAQHSGLLVDIVTPVAIVCHLAKTFSKWPLVRTAAASILGNRR